MSTKSSKLIFKKHEFSVETFNNKVKKDAEERNKLMMNFLVFVVLFVYAPSTVIKKNSQPDTLKCDKKKSSFS